MSNRKKITMTLEALDKFSAPFRVASGALRNYSSLSKKTAAKSRDNLKKLNDISSFKELKKELASTASKLKNASKKSMDLAKKIGSVQKPTSELKAQFRQAKREEDRLSKSHAKQSTELSKMGAKLREAKIDTDKLAAAKRKLERDQTRLNAKLSVAKYAGKARSAAGKGLGFARSSATTGLGVLGGTVAAGAGLGYLFKSQFIDTAAQFERFQTILETTEGSKEKAAESMKWVEDFAGKTPYELDEVTGAFVKMRSFGLDPKKGLLKTLGDTSAAMGKPLEQAVEAIADAVTGENERLKEFGITSSTKGNQVTYEYTNKLGKTMKKTVQKGNREMIQSTLAGIWNEKYAGSMDKLSKTWGGMMSNLADYWTRFKNLVMKSGPFDYLKSKAEKLLAKLDKLKNNGGLEKYAKKTGEKILELFKKIEGWLLKLWDNKDKFYGFFEAAYGAAKKLFNAILSIAGALKDISNIVLNPIDSMFNTATEKTNRHAVRIRRGKQPAEDASREKVVELEAFKRKSRANAQRTSSTTITNNVTVHAAPGMNEEAIANKVIQKVKSQNDRRVRRTGYDR